MLKYTGHPLVDVGVATLTAFAGKRDPSLLTEADLDQAADYMEKNYTVDPLKSFLTVAFPNSGFTQPAYEKQPEKRKRYADRMLRSYRASASKSEERCVFTGNPATATSLNVDGTLPPGRTFRQHVPLLTGEGVINFYPYGDAGLPVSGEILLALQAFPLGCAKVAGRLLAVHADDPAVTYYFARRSLERNRQDIQLTQQQGGKKLPEYSRRPGTLVVERLTEPVALRAERQEEERPVSLTAYHLTNSGQGVDLNIYHLPLEISDFLITALTPNYRPAWDALVRRGWEMPPPKGKEDFAPRYNVLYEDLFHLPEESVRFIRRYFLRIPDRQTRPGDPRAGYSIQKDVALVSWQLTSLFLEKVVKMNKERIGKIRELGDALAEYVAAENDPRFFHTFLTARYYDTLRAALIRVSVARIKHGQPPLIAFDPYIEIFEEGEDLPRADWRLARDLVLIRLIEQLHARGWMQAHAQEIPESPSSDENAEKREGGDQDGFRNRLTTD